jgi:hypothetical protein
MSYVRRFQYTLIEIYEQRSTAITHEVISPVPAPITAPPAVNPPHPSDRKNGIFEPTDFWMGR